MINKKCSKCGIEKGIDKFTKRKGATDGYNGQCMECTRIYTRDHYENNKKMYKDKARKNNLVYGTKIHKYLVEYCKKNPCVDCGESDLVVLEFDHRDGKSKKDCVSKIIASRSLVNVIEEIKKCDVRCANCHRRKTAKDFNWYEKYK